MFIIFIFLALLCNSFNEYSSEIRFAHISAVLLHLYDRQITNS